ncbi:MAG: hypothetical protein AAF404_05210 [Pseudomonadota bacterium]
MQKVAQKRGDLPNMPGRNLDQYTSLKSGPIRSLHAASAGREPAHKNNKISTGDTMWASKLRSALGALFLCALAGSPQVVAEDLTNQFEHIKEFLVDTVTDAQRVGAATTYALLRDNLSAFHQLKARVDSATHIDDIIDELSLELDNIASNFERAARLRVDYARQTDEGEIRLADKRLQTSRAIGELERRIGVMQREIDDARGGVGVDPQRRDVTVRANTSVINSLQTQIAIWRQFEDTQQRLATSLKLSTDKVDFLLFVLEKNALVYREAANTAKLRQSVRLALSNLQALGAIEHTLSDLASSWQEVDRIIGEIGRTELGYASS